jgi:hypothetical protein
MEMEARKMANVDELREILETMRIDLAGKTIEAEEAEMALRENQDSYLSASVDTAIAFAFLYKTQSIMMPIKIDLVLVIAANAATALLYVFLFKQDFYTSLLFGVATGGVAAVIAILLTRNRGGVRVTLENGRTTSIERNILNYFKTYKTRMSDDEYSSVMRDFRNLIG